MEIKTYGSGEYKIITADPNMHNLIEKLERAAGKDTTINLIGPTGTGKGALARYIHSISNRQDGPFVEINCAAFPETLIESELFGYVKGAFTGAYSDKPGALEKANGGTFFMDEKDKMSLAAQWKLLKALEDGYQKLGSRTSELIRTDTRMIIASSVSPEEAREDEDRYFDKGLHYRLGGIYIELPPLIKRGRKDIELLAKYYCEVYAEKYNTPVFVGDDVLAFLYEYHWPGNVRELKNCMDGAVALSKVSPGLDKEPLKIEDIESALYREKTEQDVIDGFLEIPETSVHGARTLRLNNQLYMAYMLGSCDGNTLEATKALGIGRATLYRNMGTFIKDIRPQNSNLQTLRNLDLREWEKEYVLRVLKECDGNHTKAAERLGIARNTLWRKLKEYGQID